MPILQDAELVHAEFLRPAFTSGFTSELSTSPQLIAQ